MYITRWLPTQSAPSEFVLAELGGQPSSQRSVNHTELLLWNPGIAAGISAASIISSSRSLRRPRRARAGLALGCLLLMAGCRQAERSDNVQLVLSTQQLEAGTTFELRFEQAMVRGGMVGADTTSPLVFSPRVPGRFVWTSSRSGIFTPSEPLALGTEYKLSLRLGLQRADGQESQATLTRRFHTPPFGVVSCHGTEASTNAASQPELHLWFNADVRAADVAPLTGFANAEGRWIPGKVRQGLREDRYYWGGDRPATWRARFQQQRLEHTPAPGSASPDEETIGNLLVLTPTQALSVGHQWKLVVSSGVPSADGRMRSPQVFERLVGDVQPFSLQKTTMHHYVYEEPTLELEFSKDVDQRLTNSYIKWLELKPAPADLVAEVYGSKLFLHGNWQRDTDYTVTVRRGFPAAEPFGLPEPATFSVSVPPVDPRLYFPAFANDQFAGGRRAFSLVAVNVNRVRVRAKLLEPATGLHVLRGYEDYLCTEGSSRGTPYRRQNYNLVPGRTVAGEEMAGPSAADVAAVLPLDWDRLLHGRKTGVVFLEAERLSSNSSRDPLLGAQALVQLTDLGLAWKFGNKMLRVFVFSYATGQPVSRARVQICSDENELLQEVTTDAAGEASLAMRTNAAWLLAQSGEDWHAVKLADNHLDNSYAYELPASLGSELDREARRIALFTDRDAYRPGETVNLKAIVRDLDETGLSIPAGATGLVACVDARGKEFFHTNIALNAWGSCDAAIPLPGGPCGDYRLTLNLIGREAARDVIVADYQPGAFEISLSAKPNYAAGEKIVVPLSANYYFGKSLDHARFHWSVEAEDQPLRPPGFDEFEFGRAREEQEWGRGRANFATAGEGRLERSNNAVRLDLPLNAAAPQPRAVSLLVEVTDLNQQTISRAASFLKHSSEFYLGLKHFADVIEPRAPLPVQIAAVGADAAPWREPVPARLSLYWVEWRTVEIQGAGWRSRYHSEASLSNVWQQDITVSPPSRISGEEKSFVGSIVPDLVAPAAGQYLLEVKAKDAAGHEVVSSQGFNVTEQASLAWNYRDETSLQLVPDKPSYQPGETALILIKTPISGQAWVTVEREEVLRSFTTRLEGNAPAVRVPIQPGDLPNIFVSVTLVRGAADNPHEHPEPEYRVGCCPLKVDDPQTHLRVEVAAGATNYLPGETVTAQVHLRDSAGEPVDAGEVTLYAVDEGVLSLTDYSMPDLHSILLAPHNLDVASGISLPLLLAEDPERLSYHNKGYLGGGGGLERLRQRFPACAFWSANLRTAADGMVAARFAAPDGMTRYRLIAVAHTRANQFGTGQAAFTISKPLVVEPAVPRFAKLTDRLQARALVLNQTEQPGEVQVTLDLDDKARSAPGASLTQFIFVNAHGSGAVDFPVEFTNTGAASWIWHARFTDASASPADPAASSRCFRDAVRSTVEVGPLMPMLHEVAIVQVQTPETNLLHALSPQLLAGEGNLTVTVANTRLLALGEAIAQLLHYPYGCVEQTSSSLLPWVVIAETPELAVFSNRDTNEVALAVRSGFQRLFSMQTSSGGLSYWPGGTEPMLWGSAYGGFVLALSRQAGLPVPEAEFKALLDYLSGQLRECRSQTSGVWEQCLALYTLALAGRPEPAYHHKLFEQRERLGLEERSLLALAVNASRADERLADALLSPAVPGQRFDLDPFGCAARQWAVRLLALAACQLDAAETKTTFERLLAGQQQGHWQTTQGNAWALLALRDYVRKIDGAAEAAAGDVIWGAQSAEFALPANGGMVAHTFGLHQASAVEPLRLVCSRGKTLFARVSVESRSQATNQFREDHGLSLQRRYARLNEHNEPEQVDRLRVGDRVLVTLKLTLPEPARYVAVDDPLPGILEAVNPEFSTQQVAGGQPPPWLARDDSAFWGSSFREVRGDRLLFFADAVPRGSYVIRYVARARAAGAVTAPPAKAEEMYHPERFGLTESQPLLCEAAE